MRLLLLFGLLSFALDAQPLPVVALQSSDLDQLVRNLRDKKPIPQADCGALDLMECYPGNSGRITDLSMRWVQLDDDPELEAVLMIKSNVNSYDYTGYIFDRQRTWNLVGSFLERSGWHSTGQSLLEVGKLTEKSPVMVLVNVDLGGSGSVFLTSQVFHLREGKLWPVMEVHGKWTSYLPPPAHVLREHVFASNTDRLIIHTINEEPPGRVVKNECEVRRWDAIKHTFVVIPKEKTEYCNPKTGKPIEDKSFATGVPVYP